MMRSPVLGEFMGTLIMILEAIHPAASPLQEVNLVPSE